MKKRAFGKRLLAALVALFVGGSAGLAAAQDSGEAAADGPATSEARPGPTLALNDHGVNEESSDEKQKFALSDEKVNERTESSGETGLRWVDGEQTESKGESDVSEKGHRDADSTAERSKNAEVETSREDSEFEQLAAGGRDADSVSEDRSLGMESSLSPRSSREQTGQSGRSFDVQFGQKSVGEIIDLHRDALVQCYRNNVSRSAPTGTVELKIVVRKDGSKRYIGVVDTSLNHEPTESCMVETVDSIEFPPPKSGEKTTWTIPFRFGE